MSSPSPALEPPPRNLAVREARAILDILSFPETMLRTLFSRPRDIGRGRHVIVVPGFGVGDPSMAPLRAYLRLHGFTVEGWGMGRNLAGLDRAHDPAEISWRLEVTRQYRGEAGVAHLCDLLVERARHRAQSLGRPISLVGWSLGGTIAREVARDLPEHIDQVVTLGSPVIGGPKYTRVAANLRRRGLDLDWIEAEVERREATPIRCRVSAIASPTDAVVAFAATRAPGSDPERFLVEDVSHFGMGFNRRVLKCLIGELALGGFDSGSAGTRYPA